MELGVIALVPAVGEEKFEWFERLVEGPAWACAGALCLMLFCLEIFGAIGEAIPFLYFQF